MATFASRKKCITRKRAESKESSQAERKVSEHLTLSEFLAPAKCENMELGNRFLRIFFPVGVTTQGINGFQPSRNI